MRIEDVDDDVEEENVPAPEPDQDAAGASLMPSPPLLGVSSTSKINIWFEFLIGSDIKCKIHNVIFIRKSWR